MSRLILPKIYVERLDDALIFLLGPIHGAPPWHEEAIRIIQSRDPSVYIASPHKHATSDDLRGSMPGQDTVFSRQTLWERHYWQLAARTGCVLCWLPLQAYPRPDGGPYMRDTRGELGELRGSYKYDKNTTYVIGAQDRGSGRDADGVSVIRANEEDVNPQRVFYTTLEETCDAAIALARRKR